MPLRQLYPNPGLDSSGVSGDTAIVDIFAVHGLNPRSKDDDTHAWDTWRTPAGPQGRLWLRDDLPQYVPNARIFLYEYNSTAVYGKDKDTFIGKANELLEAIRIERDDIESRPILFLGHSLGGLLIKQALINAHNNPKYTPIKDATTGLAFFATPHNGGDWKLVSLGAVVARVAIATGFQQGDDVLETLKQGSIFSDIMHELWRQQLMKYDIISFWGARDNVVPPESARFGMPGDRENVVKLNADHRGVCKFSASQTDQDNFKLVRANIKDIYKNALRRCAPAPTSSFSGWEGRGQQGYTTFSPPPASNFATPQPPPLPPRFPPPPSGNATPDPSRSETRHITGFMYSPTGTDARSAQVAELKNAGCWEQARQLEQQIFEEYQRTLGITHLTTLTAAYDITATTLDLGYLEDGARWADWVIQTGSGTLGAKHPLLLKVNRLKGEILIIKGQYQEAENILAGVLVDQQDRLGNDHLDTLETERELGQACRSMGRQKDAQARLEHRAEALTRRLGENHIQVSAAIIDLVSALAPSPIADPFGVVGAEPQIHQTAILINALHERLRASVGPQNQVTIRALRVCGHLKILQGETTEASDMLRRALSNAEESLGRDHPETIAVVAMIGMLYSKQDGPSFTRVGSPAMWPWFERYADWLERRLGLMIPETRTILNMLAQSYMGEKKYIEAEKYYERLIRSYQGQNSPEAQNAAAMYQLCRMNTGLYRQSHQNGSNLTSLFRNWGGL